MRFFVHFDFELTLVSPGNRQTTKKSGRESAQPKIFAKNILVVIQQKFRSKFKNVAPPPIGPVGGGGGSSLK